MERGAAIKSIFLDLPANPASVVERYVKAGFFRSEPDILLAALSEFVCRKRIELKDGFALKRLGGQLMTYRLEQADESLEAAFISGKTEV